MVREDQVRQVIKDQGVVLDQLVHQETKDPKESREMEDLRESVDHVVDLESQEQKVLLEREVNKDQQVLRDSLLPKVNLERKDHQEVEENPVKPGQKDSLVLKDPSEALDLLVQLENQEARVVKAYLVHRD